MADIFYYNVSIKNTSNQTSGLTTGVNAEPIVANVVANNNAPVCQNPNDYYASIVRFEVPCFTTPLIRFLVKTPINSPADINTGIYSFTMSYGSTFSSPVNYIFKPQIEDYPLPDYTYPSKEQNFSAYYFIYAYQWWVDIMNTALAGAFTDLQSKVGAVISTANKPFFNYDCKTQLITLYADKSFFDLSLTTPIKIYFNNVCAQLFNGFSWNEVDLGSLNGADCMFNLYSNLLNTTTLSSVNYITSVQEFVALSYLSPLKSIVISTNMNVLSEIFFINNPKGFQNQNFINVLTDFLPDVSAPGAEAGIGSKTFIYNAPSLWRIFQFVDSNPLYSVPLSIFWQDDNNNIYPLDLVKGTTATIKLMFIKKSLFDPLKFNSLKLR